MMERIIEVRFKIPEFRVTIPAWLEQPIVRLALLYRRVRYGYPFRRIRLTQGKYAIVDPEDYERLNRYKWYAVKYGRSVYAVRSVTVRKKKRHEQMHRAVMKTAKGKFCDHINHNGLDNRKANLRPVSRAENVWNMRKRKCKCSSKYKGVSWFSVKKKWQAGIQANGRKIFIGCFNNEVEAAKAYDRAALKYHGEFAALNFPRCTGRSADLLREIRTKFAPIRGKTKILLSRPKKTLLFIRKVLYYTWF